MRSAGQRLFDAAMLIAQRDFQVQHLLAGALETKMAGLDHARVDGADGHFVNLAAADAKELAVGGRVAGASPHRLEPGMALRLETVLFPYLALEKMSLGMSRSQGRITSL